MEIIFQNKKQHSMLIDFPQVLDMPTKECHDPMIDVRHYKFRKIKYSPFIDACDNLSLKEKEKMLKEATKIRLSVYKRLLKAQEILRKKYGYSIRLFCGYRNKKTQDIMFKKYWAQNQKEFPNATYYELYKKAIKLISPLKTWNGKINIPPHSTGGAIDIELIDKNGEIVDMGMDAKDAINVKSEWCWPTCTEISQKAQVNRKIMADAMTEAGFTGHTREFWHFSYGDRLWAVRLNKPHAIYDSVDLDK